METLNTITPTSLFELISKPTLEHLLTGYGENLKLGVRIGAKDGDDNFVLLKKDPDLAERVWNSVCHKYRSIYEGEMKCEEFDIKIVNEFLTPPYPSSRCHECGPLGLIDMAAPIQVQGKTLGVVLAGQRILRSEIDQVRNKMIEKNPEREKDLVETLNEELDREDSSCICDQSEIDELLKSLTDFANMISEICEAIALHKYEKWQKTKRLEFLNTISNELLSFDDFDGLISYVVKITKKILNAETSAIFLFKEDKLRRIKISGIKTPHWFEDECYRVGEGIAGCVVKPRGKLKFGKQILTNSLSTSTFNIIKHTKKYEKELKSKKVVHIIGVPLNGENRSFGVLRVTNKLDQNGDLKKDGFSNEDLYLLSTIASQVSVAIANIRKRDKLRSIFELSEYIVGDVNENQICKKVIDLLTNKVWRFKISFLQLYNEKKRELQIIAASPRDFTSYKSDKDRKLMHGKGIASKVFESGERIYCENVQMDERFLYKDWAKKNNLFSMLCVPLKFKAKIIGTLSVFTNVKYEFYPDEIRSLEIFANQTTLVLMKSQFLFKLQKIIETYPAISELSISIDNVLENIASIAKEVLDADLVVLYRYDQKRKNIIWPPVVAGKLHFPEFMRQEIGTFDAPYLIINRRLNHFWEISISDKIMQPGIKQRKGIPEHFIFREKIASSAGIILESSGEIVGVLFINYRSLHNFDESEKKIVELYSSYIAIAIQNVLHFREKEIGDALKTSEEVTQRFAHSMKTDIGGIRLFIDGVLRNCDRDDKIYYPIYESRKRLDNLKSKINHILQLSKFKNQIKENVSINTIINEFNSEILSTLNINNIKLVLDIKDEKSMLYIDPKQMKMAFSNLADNSVFYMKNGGKIKIFIYRKKNTLFIEWSDTGIGIPNKIINKIFEIGYTTKADGFGLGLFHTRAIIEEYGGNISVDSDYKKGAKFLIRLPITIERL